MDGTGHDGLVVIVGGQVHEGSGVSQADQALERNLLVLHRQQGLLGGAEDPALPFLALLIQRQIVASQDHVLAGDGQRAAVGRRQDIIGREHQGLGLDLGLDGQRDMNGHLVAVEVGVEGRADQRMDLDGLALDEQRFESLDAQAVKRRRPVEEDRVLPDDFLQEVPDLGPFLLVPFPGHLDARDEAFLLQLVENEGLEQLQGHLLGQPALVEFQLRADDDDRPARIIHPLAEQVLPEPALLAPQGLAQGFEGAAIGPEMDAAALAVVEQGVDGLLQHALLVADDELGGLEFDELLEAVVAVDDAAVKVVEVRGREPAAVEAHQRPEVGRDDRDHVQDHPLGMVPGPLQGLEDPEPLGVAEPSLLGGLLLHQLAQALGFLLDAALDEQGLDGLGANAGLELVAVLFLGVLEFVLGEQLLLLEGSVAGVEDDIGLEIQDLLQVLDGQVEDQADPARRALEEPDVGDRGGQMDVAHAFPPDLGLGHLDAAALADDPPVFHPLVLAAQALVVVDRAEDLGAEQAVLLGLERPVVDGFRLGDLTPGPALDLLGGGDADTDPVKIEPGLGTDRWPDVH